MHTRENALNDWLKSLFNHQPFTMTPLTGDASFRRYFRLNSGETTRIIMDAPPDKENLDSFICVADTLINAGVHTPKIHAMERTQGFLLLEDLGDQLLLNALTPNNADTLYTAAMNTLLQIQQASTTHPVYPPFNKTFIQNELALFHDWFLKAYLDIELTKADEQMLNQTFDWLTTTLLNQPQVFIHRDYHSRNIMLIDDHTPPAIGIIDFQDAMCGPFTYDLVSLLKDCYIQWPREHIIRWTTYFHNHLPVSTRGSLSDFHRAFDLCGLQRHLKVLGVFCRLQLRDNKPAYLRDLPLTFHYVLATLECYDALAPLHQFMQQKVQRVFGEKQAS